MKRMNIISHTKNSEMLSRLPVVEIVGEDRVLIENHLGVVGYSSEEVQIKVCYGILSVSGYSLKFLQINKEQLVINGKINSVAILGR